MKKPLIKSLIAIMFLLNYLMGFAMGTTVDFDSYTIGEITIQQSVVTVMSNGTINAVYEIDNDLVHGVSDDNGVTWSTSKILDFGTRGGESSVCVDANNNLHLVYIDENGGAYDFDVNYRKFTASTWTWSAETVLYDDTDGNVIVISNVDIVVDRDENVHVIYDYSTPYNDFNKFYVITYNGTWGSPVASDDVASATECKDFSADINMDDDIVLMAMVDSGATFDYRVIHLKYEYLTGTFTEYGASNSLSSDESATHSIDTAVDSDNNIHCVYLDEYDGVNHVIKYLVGNGNTWDGEEIFNYSGGGSLNQHPNIAINSDGTVQIVWSGDNDLVTSRICGVEGSYNDWSDLLYYDTVDGTFWGPKLIYQNYPYFTWLADNVSGICDNRTGDTVTYFDADNISWYTPPTLSDEYPTNTSSISDVMPTCYVKVTGFIPMDISFYENTTGSWILRETENSVSSGSFVDFNYTQANSPGQYWWMVNVTDGASNISGIYWFNITSTDCPYITNVIPSNNSDVYNLYPSCQFDIMDDDSITVDYEIYENTTGSWVKRQYGTVLAGDTVYWTFSQADAYNETYYWRINLTDGDCDRSWIYHFTLNLYPPTNLQVTDQTDDSLSLSWSKGVGTTHTLVLYKTGSYPDNPYDGTAFTAYFGTGTSTTISGLDNGTTFYIRAWSYLSGEYSEDYDSAIGVTDESEDDPSGPDAPGSFTVQNIDSDTRLLLQWNLGDDDWVHIRRKTTGYPNSIADGTFVYNGSGDNYYDDGLTPGELYYYKAFFQSYSSSEAANITDPDTPNNFDIDVDSGSNMSLTWDNPDAGFYDTVIIRAKNNTVPTNPLGDIAVYNSTGESTTHNSSYYPLVYSIWSWVEEDGYTAYSDRVDMDDVNGNIVMNCYDEVTLNAITSWNVIVTSNTGGTVHTSYGENNPYVVDAGDWVDADYYTFKFTKFEYYSGWYSYTEDEIDTVVNFPLDAYITPTSAVNDSNYKWYQIRIENQFSNPISDVKVEFYHVVNETTGNATHIGTFYTDSYGEFQLFLTSGDTYLLNISRDGFYNQSNVRYIPSSGPYYNPYKTFVIYQIPDEYTEYVNPWDYITFTVSFSDTTSLDIVFSDSSGNTDNAYILVFENMSNSSFYQNYFGDSDESFTVPYDNIFNRPNNSRASYIIKLYIVDHPDFGDFSAIIIIPVSQYFNTSMLLDLDLNLFAILGGPGLGIGWVNFAIFGVLFFVFDIVDKKRLGVGIAIIGFLVMTIEVVLGVPAISFIQAVLFGVYCIIIGAFIEIARVKKRGSHG